MFYWAIRTLESKGLVFKDSVAPCRWGSEHEDLTLNRLRRVKLGLVLRQSGDNVSPSL